jgi:polyisoprenoid-binding protein YceI
MSKRGRYIVIGVTALVLVLGGGYLAFAILAGGNSPAPVSLSTSVGTTSPGAMGSPGGGVSSASDLAGTWQLSANDSFVGYRVREQLGFAPAPSDAVGRTAAVTGSLNIEGTSVTVVEVTADMTQLQSDRSMRDARMHTIGLETDAFPTATFVLTSPISFASAPNAGAVVKTMATGDLTVHGVTKSVTIEIQATWTSDGITVVGSTPIVMADHGITPPNVGGLVSVQDHGTMEFQLVFVKG